MNESLNLYLIHSLSPGVPLSLRTVLFTSPLFLLIDQVPSLEFKQDPSHYDPTLQLKGKEWISLHNCVSTMTFARGNFKRLKTEISIHLNTLCSLCSSFFISFVSFSHLDKTKRSAPTLFFYSFCWQKIVFSASKESKQGPWLIGPTFTNSKTWEKRRHYQFSKANSWDLCAKPGRNNCLSSVKHNPLPTKWIMLMWGNALVLLKSYKKTG